MGSSLVFLMTFHMNKTFKTWDESLQLPKINEEKF